MKKWTIILENEFKGDHCPKTVVITEKQVKIFITIITIVFIFSLGIFGIAKFNHLEPNAKFALNARKEMLLREICSKNMYIDGLIDNMEKYVNMEKNLRVLANLEPLPDDIRKLGVGGYTVTDKRIEGIEPGIKKIVNNLDSRLFQAMNIIKLEKSNIEDININLSEQCNHLKHKPSIIPTNGWITSKFGIRKDPLSKKIKFHHGLDIANDYDTPIYASANGEVIFTGTLSGYGNSIKIDHGYGYMTLYGHLKEILVKVGDKINRHQQIALMGNSGRSTGPHLHYEVRIFNKKIDPFDFIDRDTVVR